MLIEKSNLKKVFNFLTIISFGIFYFEINITFVDFLYLSFLLLLIFKNIFIGIIK